MMRLWPSIVLHGPVLFRGTRLTITECLRVPEVPVTVTRWLPDVGPQELGWRVTCEVVCVAEGLNCAPARPGPEAARSTVELKLNKGLTVMVVEPVHPEEAEAYTTGGLAKREKSGGGGVPPTSRISG